MKQALFAILQKMMARTYAELYAAEAAGRVTLEDFAEQIARFDALLKSPERTLVSEFVTYRGAAIISDREAAAFTLALDALKS